MKTPRLVRGVFYWAGVIQDRVVFIAGKPAPTLIAFQLDQLWELACLRWGQPGLKPYTENRATMVFKSTAKRDSS